MNVDIQDLKAIAERCKGHQPLRFMQSYGALYIRNDNGIVFDVHQNRSFPDFMSQNKDYADLVLAANPAAVLDLIAELEKFDDGMRSLAFQLSAGGYNAVTLTSDQLVAKVADGLEMFTEATGQLLHKVTAERDQLKAENEALRKDARRWQCVRNAIPMQSPYAVWREGSHLVLGNDADELVDNFLSHAKETDHD